MSKLVKSSLVAVCVFAVSVYLGTLVPPSTSSQTLQQIGDMLQPLKAVLAFPPLLILIIFLNNALKSLGAIVLGVAFGVPTLVFLAMNGFTIGVLMVAVYPIKGWAFVAASLLPHGIIELPMILFASALGLALGWESLRWASRRQSAVGGTLKRGLKLYVRWILPGLLVAAVTEVLVTPLVSHLFG